MVHRHTIIIYKYKIKTSKPQVILQLFVISASYISHFLIRTHSANSRIAEMTKNAKVTNLPQFERRNSKITGINHNKHTLKFLLFENKSKGKSNTLNLRTFCNALIKRLLR